MIESARNSADSLLSSENFLSSTPGNQNLSNFNNLTTVLFNINEESKPFANNLSDNASDEFLQNINNKFNKIVMIIKLSRIVTTEDNFGTGDYFLNNVVFLLIWKRYLFFKYLLFL
jgi:hypothetical protein